MQMFTKAVLMSAVAEAIAAGGAGGQPAKTEEQLRVGKYMTPQGLDEFFDALEGEKPSDEVAARMETFKAALLNMDTSSVSKLLKDFAAKDRHEKLAAQAKTETEKQRILTSLYDVHRNRAKEARQIYGAVKFAGLDLTGKGWSRAYEDARKALGTKEIKWDGTKAPTPEEQEKNAGKRTARRVAQETKDAVQDLVNAGADIKPEHYTEIAQRVQDSMNGRDARKKAIQMVRGMGPEMAELVMQSLPEIIAIAKANGEAGLDAEEEKLSKATATADIVRQVVKPESQPDVEQVQERKAA